jgi:hypothetical protein
MEQKIEIMNETLLEKEKVLNAKEQQIIKDSQELDQ